MSATARGAVKQRSIWAEPLDSRDLVPGAKVTISVPEHLRSCTLDDRRLPGHLRSLFWSARLHHLGDLHGKRVSDFAHFRNCGKITLRQLECLAAAIQRPGAAWPPPLRHGRREGVWSCGEFRVPAAAGWLRPEELPISQRLETLLRKAGVGQLAELDGKTAGYLVKGILVPRQRLVDTQGTVH